LAPFLAPTDRYAVPMLDATPAPQASTPDSVVGLGDALARRIREDIAAGDKANAHAEEHYKRAGQRLITLQEQKPKGITWAEYVKRTVGISYQRAWELISLAKGKTNLDEMQRKCRDRVALLRNRDAAKDVIDAANPSPPARFISSSGARANPQHASARRPARRSVARLRFAVLVTRSAGGGDARDIHDGRLSGAKIRARLRTKRRPTTPEMC
jgi:hypothetical protein